MIALATPIAKKRIAIRSAAHYRLDGELMLCEVKSGMSLDQGCSVASTCIRHAGAPRSEELRFAPNSPEAGRDLIGGKK